MKSKFRTLALTGAALFMSAGVAHAQQPGKLHPHQQAISANPFGLLIELFNAEYERIVTEAGTAGFGGSTISDDDDRYINADVFFRYYPEGIPLNGWAFGAKVGLTRVPGTGTYFGYGFDVNRSWLMGANNNFYVGLGFGLKRLIGTPAEGEDSFGWNYIPTFRVVNIGFAF
ncbi:hypothetical protein BH23GEM9_BH23GEM9_25710 [soil metagenome]